MPYNINYKHLHYFWVVAHEGSIAKASKKLHITPQTISGQLALLEERVGSRLFEKVGRGLSISEAGRLVLRYADEIFELGRELADVLRGADIGQTSEFIVSSASALPKTIVYKIIEPSLRLAHDISLTSKEGPVESILAELALHKVDMVLSDKPLSGALSIKAYSHYLGESKLTLFASASLARSYRNNFPGCLHSAPLLLPTHQYAVRNDLDQWFRDKNIYPKIRGQFDDSALIKSFGQSGVGLFFMPSVIKDEVCRNFNVRPIAEIEGITHKFYAISAERKVRHPAVAAICDNARKSLFD